MRDTLIYLDNNATTAVDNRVVEVINIYFNQLYGNASSLYNFGSKSKLILEQARTSISDLIDAEPESIYFTSGATESVNLALKGLALSPKNSKKHIITCSTEHKAVLETCEYLQSIGYEIDYLPVNNGGAIDLEVLKSLIKEDTLLVCLMWVNNETGVIHPINEIGKITKAAGVYFVCDGSQGVGKLPISVTSSNIDIFCFSGHKLYASKGVGGIYIGSEITRNDKIQPLIHGGGQEDNLRSGTHNVPLIAGLGKAFEIAREEMQKNEDHIVRLKTLLESELSKMSQTSINGVQEPRIFNTVNVCILGLDSEVFIGINSDIAVSNGSACTSALVQPSHVLLAMGLSTNDAMDSIRISIGKYNTESEIHQLIERINNFIN
ncbi:cysteine desulfurase family protein [Flavobacterium johnsoniae]|uniref:cysteine desulfurase n=1 Tax=Flavobacterium johnsoniae (strain ATCC 17061 / DSM 2064 / JCM 8514 / BCRC 14874 / CCUG 350202 / NBRC 14942 / NCIMB 11054 / UW101) TaxID=376686 RepID=A5FFI2_FLAJ1|nr:cysteine desulfurase family protein [Flavobacterium johnsoniae]ABQ06028.1 aminotransferase, class V [Flavobacterium johnsoniae UW101]OXG00606.1 IscS subfamily cysteine desulfurase [Flavobacterium johnsoniae UW101]WQG81766.1 cysteine desulfurase family protein [Flavobacterium johnsoniae UW101]SHK63627.1 cysteine desulfurase [Flavobacterium johnsoniae]